MYNKSFQSNLNKLFWYFVRDEERGKGERGGGGGGVDRCKTNDSLRNGKFIAPLNFLQNTCIKQW